MLGGGIVDKVEKRWDIFAPPPTTTTVTPLTPPTAWPQL